MLINRVLFSLSVLGDALDVLFELKSSLSFILIQSNKLHVVYWPLLQYWILQVPPTHITQDSCGTGQGNGLIEPGVLN